MIFNRLQKKIASQEMLYLKEAAKGDKIWSLKTYSGCAILDN